MRGEGGKVREGELNCRLPHPWIDRDGLVSPHAMQGSSVAEARTNGASAVPLKSSST